MRAKITPPEHYYYHETDRLVFRPLTALDIPSWRPFFEDPVAQSYVGMNGGIFRDMDGDGRCAFWINRQMERRSEGVFGQLAICDKESGDFLGLGGIITRTEEGFENMLEITYSLLPKARGKGVATELAVYFKNWAFEQTHATEVISIIHEDNQPSMNVASKNGMKPMESTSFFEMPVCVYRAFR